jgi:predicted transposase/invertase (TIGR01784 family)
MPDRESPEVIKMLAHDNKDIRHAYTLLEVISQDKIKRMAYEARQAELMDQRSRMISAEMRGEEIGIKKGEEIGIKKGKSEMIQALLTRGMSVDDVAEIAGMNREQVAEMQAQMQTSLPGNA